MRREIKTSVIGAFSMITIGINAQVGIGTNTPHPNAVLDLTNTNQKVMVLPKLASHPSNDTLGMLYFSSQDSVAYFHDGIEFNGVSPWKYNYGTAGTDYLYYNPSTFKGVGIGLNNPTIGNLVTLHLASSSDASATGTAGSLLIGDTPTADHMLIDADEILVKRNANTLDTLKLQEGSAGIVQVGSSVSNNAKFNVFGKVQEGGNDLVPSGVIVMWSGTIANIPNGWVLCNGLNSTPNLTERFIVGAGSVDNTSVTGTTQYAPGAGGNGNNFITLSSAQCAIPSHTHTINHGHTINDPGHNHSFDLGDDGNSCSRPDDTGGIECSHNTSTKTTGITVNNHTGSSGAASQATAASSHENRPPYYALAFIMKQ